MRKPSRLLQDEMFISEVIEIIGYQNQSVRQNYPNCPFHTEQIFEKSVMGLKNNSSIALLKLMRYLSIRVMVKDQLLQFFANSAKISLLR